MLRDIWILMLLLGFLCMIISLLLLFVWRVPDLIDEISGRKAKRQIMLMHEMSSSTGSLRSLSDNEMYFGMPSGSLITGELANISDTAEIKKIQGDEVNIENDVGASYMSEESSTSYVDSDEESTSYLSEQQGGNNGGIKICILEEQSSL